MGSSTVMICASQVELRYSIMAAREEVFPEPVMPVTRMRPRSLVRIFFMESIGRRSSTKVGIFSGMWRIATPIFPL